MQKYRRTSAPLTGANFRLPLAVLNLHCLPLGSGAQLPLLTEVTQNMVESAKSPNYSQVAFYSVLDFVQN